MSRCPIELHGERSNLLIKGILELTRREDQS
jgi:hypothetical protein